MIFILRNQKKFLDYKQFIRNFRGGLDFFHVTEDAYYEKYLIFCLCGVDSVYLFLIKYPWYRKFPLKNE